MAENRPGVLPMLAYENGINAMEWLAKAFGFVERARIVDAGVLTHGEMDTGGGLIMIAQPSSEYESPRSHQGHCDRTSKWLRLPWIFNGVLVYVDNVDEHYKRAVAGGATILTEPETGFPGPRYRAEDLGGHRWMFLQRDAQ